MKPLAMLSRILAVPPLLLTASAAEPSHPAAIKEVKIEEVGIPFPAPLLNRMEVAKLQAPEVREAWKEIMPGIVQDGAGEIDLSVGTSIYRATDGTTYCCDHGTMSLWIRRGDQWECLLQSLNVNKTFGGAPPRMPVKYLGKGFFAFSQTMPTGEKELPGDRFPQARAITYLLDAKGGKVVARGESFRYDHTPPVKVPPEWYVRIGIEAPAASE